MKSLTQLAGWLSIAAACLLACTDASAAIKPDWIRKGEQKVNKERVSDNYTFKLFQTWDGDYDNLWENRFEPLIDYLCDRYEVNPALMKLDSLMTQPTTYRITFRDEEGEGTVYAQRAAVYSTFEDFTDNDYEFNYYQLYAVTERNADPVFDTFETIEPNNGKATLYSLVPGAGQFYKGDTQKGGMILGSEVLLAASAIVCQYQTSYDRRRLRDGAAEPESWQSKTDSWKAMRNLSLIGMAGIYLFNLIDAATAQGGSRLRIGAPEGPKVSLEPSSSTAGVALVYRF